MSKRRNINRRDRKRIHGKTHGHCAYCGCTLPLEKMTVDHVVSLASQGGNDDLSNLLPACRSCNHRKGTSSLEGFRSQIESCPRILARDSPTYRNAVRFGLVVPNPHRVVFYFEREEGENKT
jgi:hypothetical protein